MGTLTVSSTPPSAAFTVLIVPSTALKITDIPLQEAAKAGIILTADGRCLKNRYERESETVLKVLAS